MSGTARPTTGAPAADAGERFRALAGLARKESRAHRALALLVEREVRLHQFLKKLADDAAGQQLQERSSAMLQRLGAKHVEQEETGRKEVWAHTQLAASTEARALAFERILDLEPGLGDEPVFQEPPESKEAADARHLLDRHAGLAKEEEAARRRDIALTRLALGRLKRRKERGQVKEGLAGRTKEDDALRARRWTQSSRTHFAMARLLEKQRRAHLLLADLLAREAAVPAAPAAASHAASGTAAGAASGIAASAASGTPSAGAEHPWALLKSATLTTGRVASAGPVWAHQRLAARCAARAGWHEACAGYLATSLEASGARPARPATRRPAWTERKG